MSSAIGQDDPGTAPLPLIGASNTALDWIEWPLETQGRSCADPGTLETGGALRMLDPLGEVLVQSARAVPPKQ